MPRVRLQDLALPDFQFKSAVAADEFEVGAVGGDEARSVGSGGQGDEDVEVEVAELVGLEALIGANFCQYVAGLQPVVLCWGQDGAMSGEIADEVAFLVTDSTARQFRDHYR